MLYKKKGKYCIDIKHDGHRIVRGTAVSDKSVARLIHDDFVKELEGSSSIPEIEPIIRRHIHKDSSKTDAPITEKVASVVDLSYRLEKVRIRKKLLSFATENIKSKITALTLPGTEWLFERDLLLTNKCARVVGLEGSRERYMYSICCAPGDKRISFLNMTDKAYGESSKYKDKFNFIWLDYMCNFSESSIAVWKSFLSKERVADNCVLALTFISGRERDADILYKDYLHLNIGTTHNEARKAAIPQFYADVAEKYGYSASVLASETYREEIEDKKTGTMLLVVLKLSKSGERSNSHVGIGSVIHKCHNCLVRAGQNELDAIRANLELGHLISVACESSAYGKKAMITIADELTRKLGRPIYPRGCMRPQGFTPS